MDDPTTSFLREWWANKETTFVPNRWLGVPCWQNPCDVWAVQEIISETRPEVIVECGTLGGGSAALWASLLAMHGDGRVISIDVQPVLGTAAIELPIVQERVEFVTGSSTHPAIVEQIRAACDGLRTLVILDSDHSADHVHAELDAYAPLVTPGSYLIVEDGFITSVDDTHGPGPLEAVQRWLPAHPEFEVDRSRERMLFTFCPSGFLRRRETASS